MLIVLLFISIVTISFGLTITSLHYDYDKGLIYRLYYADVNDYLTCIGSIMLIICTIVIFVLCGINSANSVIDNKITMYNEENEKIESCINELVTNYMDFEKDTYSNFKVDDVIAAVSLYPELKSDELVKSQIEVYVDNNKKIKSLKEDKINASVIKWWLYFGGANDKTM